jgi:hypothetical protein
MSCDFCFVVRNLGPGHDIRAKGMTSPCMSLFFRPFDSAFTFGPKHLSLDHYHVPMPTSVASSFSGRDGEFLVNSERSFVVFTPLKAQLTYEEVLFPTSETHEPKAASVNTRHKISAGSVIVGIHHKEDPFVCVVYFMNGAPTRLDMPARNLWANSYKVILHFHKIMPMVKNKIGAPREKITFSSEMKASGDFLNKPMPTESSGDERAAKEEPDPKRAKT